MAGVGVAPPWREDGYAAGADGVQYVYSSRLRQLPVITVQAGIPVPVDDLRRGKQVTGCNNEIVLAAYNLDIPLQAGNLWVTPTQTGVVPYTCWMGMIRSSIYVVET